MNGILSVSSFCEVCSAVSRSISWARCLSVVTAESGWPRFLKNWHISSHLLLKSVSSLQRRLNLRNWQNGMAFNNNHNNARNVSFLNLHGDNSTFINLFDKTELIFVVL